MITLLGVTLGLFAGGIGAVLWVKRKTVYNKVTKGPTNWVWHAKPELKDPVQTLEELEDRPENIYVWVVDSEQKRDAWLGRLSKHEQRYGELDSLHIVITDEDELYQMEKDELGAYV